MDKRRMKAVLKEEFPYYRGSTDRLCEGLVFGPERARCFLRQEELQMIPDCKTSPCLTEE